MVVEVPAIVVAAEDSLGKYISSRRAFFADIESDLPGILELKHAFKPTCFLRVSEFTSCLTIIIY